VLLTWEKSYIKKSLQLHVLKERCTKELSNLVWENKQFVCALVKGKEADLLGNYKIVVGFHENTVFFFNSI